MPCADMLKCHELKWRSLTVHRSQQFRKILMLRHKQQAMLTTSSGSLFLHCANMKVLPAQNSPCSPELIPTLRWYCSDGHYIALHFSSQHRHGCLCCRSGSQCSKDCRGGSWPLWNMSQRDAHCCDTLQEACLSNLVCEHHQWMRAHELQWFDRRAQCSPWLKWFRRIWRNCLQEKNGNSVSLTLNSAHTPTDQQTPYSIHVQYPQACCTVRRSIYTVHWYKTQCLKSLTIVSTVCSSSISQPEHYLPRYFEHSTKQIWEASVQHADQMIFASSNWLIHIYT